MINCMLNQALLNRTIQNNLFGQVTVEPFDFGWYSLYSGVLLEVGVGNNTVLFQYKFIYMTVDHVIN